MVKVGDIIKCGGVTVTVAKIAYVEHFPATAFSPAWLSVEFWDTTGNYRSWKPVYDGGEIVRNGETVFSW